MSKHFKNFMLFIYGWVKQVSLHVAQANSTETWPETGVDICTRVRLQVTVRVSVGASRVLRLSLLAHHHSHLVKAVCWDKYCCRFGSLTFWVANVIDVSSVSL